MNKPAIKSQQYANRAALSKYKLQININSTMSEIIVHAGGTITTAIEQDTECTAKH